MDFEAFADVVKMMASNFPNWVTTLVSWPRRAVGESAVGENDIKTWYFGNENDEGSREELLRKFFSKQWDDDSKATERSNSVAEAAEEEFDDTEDLSRTDVEVEDMEAVTLETETEAPLVDDDYIQAMQCLGVYEPGVRDTAAKSPQAVPILASPVVSNMSRSPFEIAVPLAENVLPWVHLSQTPAIRSHARVTKFMEDADGSEDADDSVHAFSIEDAAKLVALPAPDFSTKAGYDSDEGAVASSSSMPGGKSLPPADLASGWLNSSPLPSQPLSVTTHQTSHSPHVSPTASASDMDMDIGHSTAATPNSSEYTCSLCHEKISKKSGRMESVFKLHVQRHHCQSVSMISGKKELGKCQRATSVSKLVCFIPGCYKEILSSKAMQTHIKKDHFQRKAVQASTHTPFPDLQATMVPPKRARKQTQKASATVTVETKVSEAEPSLPYPEFFMSGAQGDLVTTPVLWRFGIAFNMCYKLLLCFSCGEGFDLKTLWSHLKLLGSKRTNWDPELEWWRRSEVVYENHPLGPDAIPDSKKFTQIIVDSLISGGYVKSLDEIRNDPVGDGQAWKEFPLPEFTGKLRPQILGLRVFHGARKCKICRHIVVTQTSMSSHLSSAHGKGSQSDSVEVAAQTLSEVKPEFFEVSPVGQALEPGEEVKGSKHDSAGLDVAGALALLHQKKAPIMSGLEIVPDLDIKTVLPVFVGSGIDKFLRPFNRKTLHRTYRPDAENPRYSVLRSVIVKTYHEDIQPLVDLRLDGAILHLMTNCTPNTRTSRREFSALKEKSSVAAYALLELKFVWSMLESLNLKPDDKNQAFYFDKVQTSALENLDKALDKLNSESEDGVEGSDAPVSAALYHLLDKVYFPKKYKTQHSPFDSPPIAFLALQCVVADGSYANIHLIPPIMAKLQYSFRLRASHKFLSWQAECPDDDTFMRKCKKFCDDHLQDFNLSPFAKLRRLLHLTSVTAKSTPRPNLVWWQDDSVTVGTVTINIPEYKTFLSDKLQAMEKFVNKNILLGVSTVQEIGSLFDISNLKDLSTEEDVLGNGLLLDGRNSTLDNQESGLIFLRMLQQGKLGMTRDATGAVKFGRKESAEFVASIDTLMADLQPMCHATEGPGVGRMTEDAIYCPINTLTSDRNVVFETGEHTGGFRTGYHKNSFTTGQNREILRLLPFRVFLLLYILIHIIRPIELAVLFDHFVKPEQQAPTVTAYRERVWVSLGRAWTPVRLSANLQRFMKRGLGVKMGARLYRHFAIAVQRHYPDTNYGRYQKDPTLETYALAADLMAGHTQAVADGHYAREPSVLTSAELKAAFIRVSTDWHKLLGLWVPPRK